MNYRSEPIKEHMCESRIKFGVSQPVASRQESLLNHSFTERSGSVGSGLESQGFMDSQSYSNRRLLLSSKFKERTHFGGRWMRIHYQLVSLGITKAPCPNTNLRESLSIIRLSIDLLFIRHNYPAVKYFVTCYSYRTLL